LPKLDGTKTHTNLKEAFAGEFDKASKELAD